MTTQLIDPAKVFQFVATLKPNGHITTLEPENISMNLEDGILYAEHRSEDYAMAMGEYADYTWEQRQTREGIPASVNTPTIFYVPFIPDTSFTQNIVQGNSVQLNGNAVISAQGIDVEIQLTEDRYINSNIWEVKYLGIKV